MSRILNELRRLAPAGDRHAGPNPPVFGRDGGAQVHGAADGREHPSRAANHAEIVAQLRLAHQIDNSRKRNVPPMAGAYLHEAHNPLEPVYHSLEVRSWATFSCRGSNNY